MSTPVHKSIIPQLILKDWRLVRRPMMGYAALSLLSLTILSFRNELLFTIGSILLLTVVVVVGAHLVMVTIINERKLLTLPFVLSLPVTYPQLMIAKLVANLGIFAAAWLGTTMATVGLILSQESRPNGLVPICLIILLEIAIGFLLTFSVAMVTQSEAWTIIVMTAGNVSISIVIQSVARIPAIGSHLNDSTAHWNSTALSIIGGELVAMAAIVMITVLMQIRKRDPV